MNLNTADQANLVQELQTLLRQQDDNAGEHSIWVDTNGGVHITRVPETPIYMEEWAQTLPQYKFRKETTGRGNGYVGPSAANELSYVRELLGKLLDGWNNNVHGFDDN